MRLNFHDGLVALALLSLLACLSAGADPVNPTPAFELPGDDASFQRLTVDSGGKTPTLKKIDPAWAKSLADRGEPVTYTKDNSKNFSYLGMPVGGIGAGELYLSGDGKLWEWDVMGSRVRAGFPVEQGASYTKPHVVNDPMDPRFQTVVQQGFVLQTKTGGKTDVRTLDKDGFTDVKFRGQYPIGYVDYADPASPVTVELEAFSPYDPGSVADSTYPATILNYTITNTSSAPVDCTLGGWLENGIAPLTREEGGLRLKAAGASSAHATVISQSVEPTVSADPNAARDVIDDLESGTYAKWTAEGKAFRDKPAKFGELGHGYPVVGVQGACYIDSFANSHDNETGKLTSKPFTIKRPFLTFLCGGGKHPNEECVNLLVDGQVVETATGANDEVMRPVAWDVTAYKGKQAQIQVVDASSAGWGHIMADDFAQGDSKIVVMPVADQVDVGTTAFASIGPDAPEIVAQVAGPDYAHALLDAPSAGSAQLDPKSAEDKLVSGLRRHITLAPGEKKTLSFAVTWYFPNSMPLALHTSMKREYTTRFTSAADVAHKVAADFQRLTDTTRRWHDTWYDSTLPWWFLDRTFLNTSTLATSTSYYLADGRFYGYEGRYSCPGTCTHVWGYQPAIGFLFPDIEKAIMEKVEFKPGLGMNSDGSIAMRGEFGGRAVDGQAGCILRTYLAHKMSGDDAFLRANYPSVKKAMQWLIDAFDKAQQGILIGGQANTMDAAWYGEIPWLSLHYQAALRATAEMADETGDHDYATKLRGLADTGRAFIENKLWNGEYFFDQADPAQPKSPGTYNGCPLEQLMGQSWAFTVGLGTIIDPDKAGKALDSIWQYNYTTDVGPYRQAFPKGRWYRVAGEPGLIMCTYPRGSADTLNNGNQMYSAYNNECWTGSEFEITTEMMWAGQVDKALAEVRTVNDAYNGATRNPWDEDECGSHYSRAMSSFGVFPAACGYEYDGPKQTMAFAPRVHPEDFRAAFLAAQGWGSFSQKAGASGLEAKLEVRHGKLALRQLALILPEGDKGAAITATVGGEPVKLTTKIDGRRVTLAFAHSLHLAEGQSLAVALH